MNFHGGQFHQKDIIDFSVNIPQLEYPEGFEDVIKSALLQIKKYPDIDGLTARNAIADYNCIGADQIVLGNGATELIYLMSRALNIKKATIIQPTFTEYNRALVQNNVEVTHFYLNSEKSFELDPQELILHLNETDSDMLVLCNPNNPTGNLIESDVIKEILLKVHNKEMIVMIDESFMDFVADFSFSEHREKISELINRYSVIVIRSLTKNFMIPGIRIGYAIGSEKVVGEMNEIKEPWSLNAFALECVPFFLKQNVYLEDLKKWCHKEYSFLLSKLNEIEQITAFRSNANFVLFRLDIGSPTEFMTLLIEGGVYVRPCDDFKGLDYRYFRIAIRNRTDNIKLIQLIMEAIQRISY